VIVELSRNIKLPIRETRFELDITAFAHANGWRRGVLHDPQASVRHDRSLPHSGEISWLVQIKRHQYRPELNLDNQFRRGDNFACSTCRIVPPLWHSSVRECVSVGNPQFNRSIAHRGGLSMTKLRTCGLLTFAQAATMLFLFCIATVIVSRAQASLTTLVDFDQTNGKWPYLAALVQGTDGTFYGTTLFGGASDLCFPGCGTIFKMTPSGTLTTLYSFCSLPGCPDGRGPVGTLVEGATGDFYGVTGCGDTITACSNSFGTVFKITPGGGLTTLYSFCALANCADGEAPGGGLVQARNGNFYGTTALGGAYGQGTVFEITPAGELTTLYNFCSLTNCPDGASPEAPLVQATDGNVYGETYAGGEMGYGSIFKITPAGKLTTLYSFDLTDGAEPIGGLIQAANGNFYGITVGGGNGDYFCQIEVGCGTVFEITSAGELTTIHDFCTSITCTDGAQPFGPLVQATDGNFYGTTYGYPASGPVNEGTAFEITPKARLTTLFTFGDASGFYPTGGLLQATNGTFYGTTLEGGTGGEGTVFSLSNGLGPLVRTQPTSSKEGTMIGIFGEGFTRSSVVQFGGVQATSVKLSGSTFLTAIVPTGALTGPVTVTTGGTTLASNPEFRVTPQLLSFNPPSGPVGTQVTITGTGFTQTVGVGFGNNVPAQLTVNSDTEITATVPAGGETGPVGVVTKGGTAVSSATFTVN
jgi:uncharacterized repeat protein (TIGR03803 family)